MLVVSIAINTTSTISVYSDKEIYEDIKCFFPQIVDHLVRIHNSYTDIGMVALHGPAPFTSKVLPLIKTIFENTMVVVDGGKNDSVSD